jgi:hypothetical protein
VTSGRVHVDELILIGDIPDSCLAGYMKRGVTTSVLFNQLRDVLSVGKVVYLPGNHDHTLWSSYRLERPGQSFVTEPRGEVLLSKGQVQTIGKSAEAILALFSYPSGDFWKGLAADKSDFCIANPLYASVIDGRTYVFTHGTHFRDDVINPEKATLALSLLGFRHNRLGLPPPEGSRAVVTDLGLEGLEEAATWFVDWLWAGAGDDDSSPRDELWYLWTQLRGRFGEGRQLSGPSERYHRTDLSASARVKQLVGDDGYTSDSLNRWQDIFLRPMLQYLSEAKLLMPKLTFVYGDTHEGGYAEIDNPDPHFAATVPKIRIYNTGGWVVDAVRYHPPCHAFAVDEQGEEYIMDFSFTDALEGDEPVLKVAQRDVENVPSSILGAVADVMESVFSRTKVG